MPTKDFDMPYHVILAMTVTRYADNKHIELQ